jgi:hypothetical protein
MAKMVGHASKSMSPISKLKANGPACYFIFGGQDYGQYVLPTLDSCVTATTLFDLCMSKFGHNTFILVIKFINSKWVPCHVTMGLFETTDMVRIAMVTQIKDLFSFYNLLDKIIAFVHPCTSFELCC